MKSKAPSQTANTPFMDLTLAKSADSASTGAKSKGIPFWGDSPGAWETVIILGKKMPGICDVRGKGFEQRIDKKNISGRNGAKTTHLGRECATIDIVLKLWTAQHLSDFATIIPVLKPRPKVTVTAAEQAQADKFVAEVQTKLPTAATQSTGFVSFLKAGGYIPNDPPVKQYKDRTTGGPKPVQIYHPALALFKINKVTILSCTFPEREGQSDVYTVRMTCEEFVTGANVNGAVTTNSSDYDLTKLGGKTGGAIQERLRRDKDPAKDNTGPQ